MTSAPARPRGPANSRRRDICCGCQVLRDEHLSQVEYEVAARLGAADQRAACGRVIDRVWGIADRPGQQTCLAGMAYAGAAGPPDRHIASFSELQEAGIAGVPGRPATRSCRSYQGRRR